MEVVQVLGPRVASDQDEDGHNGLADVVRGCDAIVDLRIAKDPILVEVEGTASRRVIWRAADRTLRTRRI